MLPPTSGLIFAASRQGVFGMESTSRLTNKALFDLADPASAYVFGFLQADGTHYAGKGRKGRVSVEIKAIPRLNSPAGSMRTPASPWNASVRRHGPSPAGSVPRACELGVTADDGLLLRMPSSRACPSRTPPRYSGAPSRASAYDAGASMLSHMTDTAVRPRQRQAIPARPGKTWCRAGPPGPTVLATA